MSSFNPDNGKPIVSIGGNSNDGNGGFWLSDKLGRGIASIGVSTNSEGGLWLYDKNGNRIPPWLPGPPFAPP